MRFPFRAVSAAAVVLALAAGCSSGKKSDASSSSTTSVDDSVATTTSALSSTTTSSLAASTTSTTARTSATSTTLEPGTKVPPFAAPEVSNADAGDGATLPDGLWFGFVRSSDPSARTVSFDLAQWFTGEKARAAAQQDGQEAEDFYIRNASTKIRVEPVAPDALLALAGPDGLGGSPEDTQAVTLAQLAKTRDLIAWITVKNGRIAELIQQWTP